MKKTKVLIAFPGEEVYKLFYSNIDIIFFDNKGFDVYSEISHKREIQNNFFDNHHLDTENTRDLISWWSPTWTRWVSNASKYEHLRTNSFILVNKICSGILHLNIKKVIFHTSVPHHIDTSLLSIACVKTNTPQIFLYMIVFDERLLPLVQYKKIFDRQPVNKQVSKISYNLILEKFIENKKKGFMPNTNTSLSYAKKSFYLSTIKIILRQIVLTNHKIFKKKNDIKFIPDIFHDYSLFDFLKMLLTQKSFINYYNKIKLNLEESQSKLNESKFKLIIAAHYQPEATSFPEGGNYSNHIEILLKIRSLGYTEEILYKEHPSSWLYYDSLIGGITRVGLYRSKSYLKNLKSFNCAILDENIKLEIVNPSNYIPITITGTIAIERSLVGLKTIVCGQPFFKNMPGIIHIDDIKNIDQIENIDISPNEEIAKSSKLYLLDMLNNKTITNCPGIGSGKKITDNESISNFSKELNILIN